MRLWDSGFYIVFRRKAWCRESLHGLVVCCDAPGLCLEQAALGTGTGNFSHRFCLKNNWKPQGRNWLFLFSWSLFPSPHPLSGIKSWFKQPQQARFWHLTQYINYRVLVKSRERRLNQCLFGCLEANAFRPPVTPGHLQGIAMNFNMSLGRIGTGLGVYA